MASGSEFTKRYLHMMFASLKDATPEQVQEELEHCRNINRKPVRVPRYFRGCMEESLFTTSQGFNMQVFTTQSRPGNDKNLVIYIHGGACIYQPVFFHWRFIHDLAVRSHAKIMMPVYPKAPEYACPFSMEALLEFYQHCAAQYTDKNLILMGDSIGGCMALSMTQEIHRRGWKPVADLVMLSPSVDITYPKEKEMLDIEPVDKMLKLERIQYIMNLWRGELPKDHPWVSPIYGDLGCIPNYTMLYYGSDEILKVDAEMLIERCKQIGKPLHAREFPGMFHTFPMFPIKEGFEATKEIASLLAMTAFRATSC